jgi:glycosyltransferase involved in cell wall biosynthesis
LQFVLASILPIEANMKIALFINTSWNIYNFRMGLIEGLKRDGHEVHAISPTDEYSRYLIDAGIPHHPVSMDAQGINPIKDFALILRLIKVFSQVKPDLILQFTIKPNIYGSLAAAVLQIPVINNVSGLGAAFQKKNLVHRVASLLYKIAFRVPQKVFFQNEEDQKLFIESKLVSEQKTDLLPGSGINVRKFAPVEYRNNGPFVFLMIARLIMDKGLMEYINAIRIMKARGIDARFQLLGACDSKNERSVNLNTVEHWVEEGLIEYLGTTDDVKSFIAEANCVVLPSYREGTPRVLLEAASLCRPIVTTNVPGCRQVVKDKHNGLLCKPKDANSLAEKMEEMTKLPTDQLRQLGINGRKLVETEYDENFVVEKYRNAIKQLSRTAEPVAQPTPQLIGTV